MFTNIIKPFLKKGLITSEVVDVPNLGILYEYRGVPFASKSTQRWAAPVPIEKLDKKLNEKLNLGHHPPACYQKGEDIKMDEYCFYLNIYKPPVPARFKLPIVVWFQENNNQIGLKKITAVDFGELALMANVIIITVQYRLNIFGFFHYRDQFTGNYGLLDQRLALEFISNNRDNLGGDKLIITGHGSGAMSVGYHLLSASTELFAGAICHSGVPLFDGHISSVDEVDQALYQMDLSDKSDPVNYARLLDADALFTAFSNATASLAWGPVGDDGAFFESDAVKKLRTADIDSRKKPLMIGTVSFDGSSFIRDAVFTHDNFKEKVFGHIRGDFGGVKYGHIESEHEDAIIDKYLTSFHGDEFHKQLFFDLDKHELKLLAGYILSDKAYHLPSSEFAEIYRKSDGTVYHYYIDVQPEFDYYLDQPVQYHGCGHSMEMFYLFGRPKSRIDSGVSKHAFDKWESKFSDFLGGIYNEFCHNFHFDSHKKLKQWQPSGTLFVTNNATHILTELKPGRTRALVLLEMFFDRIKTRNSILEQCNPPRRGVGA